MNLINSIFYRTKYFVERWEAKRLLRAMGCRENHGYSLELVKTIATIRGNGVKPDALLDVGAHHGKFAGLFNRVVPVRKTVCVEPNEALFAIIRSQLAGFDVQLISTPLAAEKATRTYYLHPDDSMNSLVESDARVLKENFPFDNPDEIKTRQVQTTTLDDVVGEHLADARDIFIKIDTQGNELNILRHGTDALRKTCGVLCEHLFLNPYKSDYNFLELVQFMHVQGFACVAATSIAHRPDYRVSAVDFLFIRQ
ncbi:MAG: FkbM family methyltransferase [Chitinophagales bacterium]|nr:FkbM family methyltransferase [Chitinophagales bacterium]MDW8418244.1 FkbM family methyltransferase [Chitinophagales bacterium]